MSALSRLLDEYGAGKVRRPLRILGASGQLGYGIPDASFKRGLAMEPDMIGCDMGSIDIGPYYLGSGKLATSPSTTRQDLVKVLLGARQLDVPLLIGTAGSAGAAPHLAATCAMIRQIAHDNDLHFRLAVIAADIAPDTVKTAMQAGRVHALDGMPKANEDIVDGASHIVGQMGAEAFRRALTLGADVVIAGRACDTGIFAALPQLLGFDAGLATHMAKIVECTSICCIPGGRDPILAILDDEGFILESMAENRCATPSSVAAHSLYEQSDPYRIVEPEGHADLTHANYEALDARRTRVSGAQWRPSASITVKLEAAAFVGHRAVLLAAAADPRFIAAHDTILADVVALVDSMMVRADTAKDYQLFFRIYGANGVNPAARSAMMAEEVFLLGECVAPTADRADEVIRCAKQYLLHFGFPGRLSTAGNLAFPFTPPEIATGPAYQFSMYHLMETDDIAGLFPITMEAL